jgi:mono/diheme cytochrome c family protein
MKKVLAVVAATLFAVVAAGLGYVVATGLSAREAPGAAETRAARAIRRLAIPRGMRTRTNPIAAGPQAIAAGQKIFAGYCASCHANDGSGKIGLGQAMFPPSPDMRLPATQDMTDGELFYTIEYGIRFTGMPGWGNGTPEGEQMAWNLVHFIRHLPELTPAEVGQMEALNPKPPQ